MVKKIINGRTYYFHLSIMEIVELDSVFNITKKINDAIESENAKEMLAIAHILMTKSVCQIIDGEVVKDKKYVLKFATSGDMQTLIKEFATDGNMGTFFQDVIDTTHMDDIIRQASKENVKSIVNNMLERKSKKAPFSFKYYDNYVLMFEENQKDTIYFAYVDNDDKNVSETWKSKKDANMTVTEVYYHKNCPLNIIEGHIDKSDLKAFTSYMKELNEALSIMYDTLTYEESKMFVKSQVLCGYYDRLRDEGYLS